MADKITIMAVDDEETMLRVLKRTLEREGFAVETYAEPQHALARIEQGGIELVITDLMMDEIDGFALLERALKADQDTIVIVITAFSSVESAVKAMKIGAYDFIPKPFDPEHLLLVVHRAIDNRRLREENRGLKKELSDRDHLSPIIGVSKAIHDVKRLIEKVKETDGTVLITGESGTGKELVAKAIHAGSKRRTSKFLPINCGALPDDLLESELFGYEKGAFSGAVNRKVGLLELADGGTVFLDEVGSISQMMQVKLLRFLQDKSFMRLGGQDLIQVDVRVLAATNENLTEKVREETFRKDLYYRLNVIGIEVPPLRDRCDDIRLLTRFFIDKYSKSTGKHIKTITDAAENLLYTAPWEGNVRELENCIERAITLTDDAKITVEDLPAAIKGQPLGHNASFSFSAQSSIAEVEAMHIRSVLHEVNGNKSRAAKILDIDYSTLLRKLKNLDV